MKFISWKSGWKTYAICAIGFVLGLAQAYGIHVPGWLDWLLTFAGGGALRHGVQNQTAVLAETILKSITVQNGTVTMSATPVVAKAVQAGVSAQAAREAADADTVSKAIKTVADAAPVSNADALARLKDHTA